MTAAPHVVGDELRSVNPATLEPVGSVRATAPEEMTELVAEARLAGERWARVSLDERRRVLRAATAALVESMDDVAATVTAETGKPLVESYTAEVWVALEALGWLHDNLGKVLGPERLPYRQPYLLHKRAWLTYEPVGVVGVIAPWNFPFAIPFSQAATAVAAGNAVVVKPAEQTPLSGQWVQWLFEQAGAPPGLVRVAQGTGESVGDALARARGIGKLVFTGSTEAGRLVATRAAERLCPVVLELGGKDPMLVLDDADLERAVEGALWGSFANCGQICSGVERIYVARPLYEPFVERLAARAAELRLGRGEDPASDLGPLISEAQRAKVEELVGDAVAGGAVAVTGGRRPSLGLPGWFYEPTVLVGVDSERRIAREEIFGPVVTVAAIDNDREAVRRANDSAYALGASVWTRDPARARAVAARLEAGSVWTNDLAYSYGATQAPWGGRKQSGYGRTHSRHGLYELSHTKFVDADRGRFGVAWWYPYGDRAVEGFRGALGTRFGEGLGARAANAWAHRSGIAHVVRRTLRP
jgi:acyl-CoA reductase-like NAD-dependent aldehyde dehydrogenase